MFFSGFSVTIQFSGRLEIPVGRGGTASGIMMKISAGSERGHQAKITYGHEDPMTVVENPTRKRIQFDLHPVDPDRDSEELLYARCFCQNYKHYTCIMWLYSTL